MIATTNARHRFGISSWNVDHENHITTDAKTSYFSYLYLWSLTCSSNLVHVRCTHSSPWPPYTMNDTSKCRSVIWTSPKTSMWAHVFCVGRTSRAHRSRSKNNSKNGGLGLSLIHFRTGSSTGIGKTNCVFYSLDLAMGSTFTQFYLDWRLWKQRGTFASSVLCSQCIAW